MIYLEILELNFCKLNENTKHNIELRGVLDVSGESGRDSSLGNIEINEEYLIKSNTVKDDENGIEMNYRTSSPCEIEEN